jgi:hypothetical protein
MGKQFLSVKKLNSFGALVQVIIENPFEGTRTFFKKTINQQD